MTALFNLEEIARVSAGHMLNGAVDGMAIALFAWVVLRVIGHRDSGRGNSSTRFAVWFSALLTIAALPLLASLAPRGVSGGSQVSPSAIRLPGSWALILFSIWAVIAGAALLRVLLGLWQLRQLSRSCVPIDLAGLDPMLRATLDQVRPSRSVTLCVSDHLRVPTAIGFFHPMVVIPSWAMQELSVEELNSILIHELSHLRRWDDWTNLVQKVLKAILFFHPAVWWIESKLSLEREMACDDAVLAQTASPRAYAECLVAVAEKSLMHRGLALAQAAVNRVRQTSLRVTQILSANPLETNRPGATRIWKPAVSLVGVFFVLCIAALSRAPELVAFEDRVPQITIASSVAPSPMFAGDSNRPRNVPAPTLASFHEKRIEKRMEPKVPLKSLSTFARSAPVRSAPDRAMDASLIDQQANDFQSNEKRPMPTPVSARVGSGPPQFVWVVMQSQQFGPDGQVMWTVSVWRMMVPGRVPVETRIPAKST